MADQTKNIITREVIEKLLRSYNTRCILFLFFLFLPLLCLFVTNTVFMFDTMLGRSVWQTVSFVLQACMTLFLIYLTPYAFYEIFAQRRLLKKGDFEVTVREVKYKEKRLICRRIRWILAFEVFGTVSVDRAVYMHTVHGDMFYIVHYKGKHTIMLCYPLRMYEYKE